MPAHQRVLRLELLAMACIAACTGCGREVYRAQTRVRDDGTIERAVYQPALPECRDGRHWDRTWAAAPTATKDRISSAPIATLPPSPAGSQGAYAAAVGVFKSAAEIPDQFELQLPGRTAPLLEQQCDRVPQGFVTRYRWREVLHDVVTLPDLRAASTELADLATELLCATLRKGLGPGYDLKPLETWARDEGRAWIIDAAESYYDLAAHKQLDKQEALQAEVVALCRRHGLELSGRDGEPLPSEEKHRALQLFVLRLLRDRIRQPDGQPLEESRARAVVEWLDKFGESPAPDSIFGQAYDEVAKDRPGGKNALNERVAALAVRVIGVHSAYAPPRQFCYEVELPGMVISASGQLTNETHVSWRFLASQAYPLGYEMTAESLAPNLGAQQRLLGARRVWDRPSMIAYSALLDEEPGLAAVLQACVDQGSLEMLKAYRAQAQQEGAKGAVIEDMFKLIGVP